MPSYHPHCPILPSWCGVESFVRPMEFVRSVRALVIVSLYILLMMRVRGLHLKVEGVNGILPPESTLQKELWLQVIVVRTWRAAKAFVI